MTHAEKRDPLAESFKDIPTRPMPDGLAEKIMAPVEAEMVSNLAREKQSAKSRRKAMRLQPYAAALALIAVALGIGLFMHPLQSKNGQVTPAPQSIAQNPGQGDNGDNTVEQAMPVELSPGNHHVPQARIKATEENTTQAEIPPLPQEELANLPPEESTGEPASLGRALGAHLNDIGADPLQSEETNDDPVMTLIGF